MVYGKYSVWIAIICMFVYMSARLFVHARKLMCVRVCVCKCACVCACVRVCIRACEHVHLHIHVFVHGFVCIIIHKAQ